MFQKVRKVLMILLAGMVLLFSILYLILGRFHYLRYQNALFSRSTEGENTVYTAQVDGADAVLTVEPGGAVTYRWGDTVYGPYEPGEEPPESQDPHALTAGDIRRFSAAPEPDLRRGEPWLWAMGTFCAVITGLGIWFFRPMLLFRMAFWVEDPEAVEPTPHALVSQAMFPISFLVFAILFYVLGLRVWPI